MAARTPRSLLCAGALALAACGGGGVLAALAFVGPIGGSWQGGTQAVGDWQDDFAESLNFLDGNDPFATPQAVYDANWVSVATDCGDATAGLAVSIQMDGTDLSISVPGDAALADCAQGRFLDEITIEIDTDAGPKRYRNLLTVDPLLNFGVWDDIHGSGVSLAFNNDQTAEGNGVFTQTGCEVRAGNVTGTVFVRYFQGDPDTGELWQVQDLSITRTGSSTAWTGGSLVGLSGLVLEGGAAALQLQRRDATFDC